MAGADAFSAWRARSIAVVRGTLSSRVRAEIAKGFSSVLAKQRVMYAYGNTLPCGHLDKGIETAATVFMKRVDEVIARDRCSRTEAIEKARKENEAIFEAFQAV
jgi:hypothetical protein